MNFPLPSRPSLDPNAAAWLTTVGPANVTAGRINLVSNLIRGLKVDGVWTKINRLWLTAAQNSASAIIDLVTAASLSPINAPTFTADQGYTGNGTSSYLNTNSNSIGTQNSSAFGFYNRTNKAGADAVEFGASDATRDFLSSVSIKNADGNLFFEINDDQGDVGRAAPANCAGIYVISRINGTDATIYKGGASFATNGEASVGVAVQNYAALATISSGGTPQFFSATQNAMVMLGSAGFNATDAFNFTTRIQTYMTAIGA